MEWNELGAWGNLIDFPREKWDALSEQVERAYESTEVYPPREKLFAALNATPPEQVRVVILGQDPYHEPGQAHGLSFSVEPGVEKLYTIKLIIQPILENAIYHGMEYADGDGEIHIRAFREGETVVIEVEDNGPGMSEEIVEQLLKPTRDVSVPKAKGSGIGFRNVHQRIQLTFGSAYGLTIRSEPDNGTVVRICLPVLEEEDARKYRKEGER